MGEAGQIPGDTPGGEEERLLCRGEAVSSEFLEEGLVSWLQEEAVTCLGSGLWGGGGGNRCE